MTSLTPPSEINGRKIGYQIGAGGLSPDRPTLIMIAGAGHDRYSWRFQLDGSLSQSVNALALELPGHGQTDGPIPDSVAGYAEFVAEFLDAWDLPRKPLICGHSMGGAVGIELGLTRPDAVSGLILAATAAALPVNEAVFDGLKADFPATVAFTMKWSHAKTADPGLVEETTQYYIKNGSPDVMASDFTACDRFDRKEDVRNLSAPVMIVCGLQDKMTPMQGSEFLHREIAGSRLQLIDQAGHMLMLEQPDKFNQIVADFSSGV